MSSDAAHRRNCKRSARAAGIDRGKMSLNVDLNDPPADSYPAATADNCPAVAAAHVCHQKRSAGSHVSPIDVEAVDEDVQLLSNPRNFPQARRRRRRTQDVVDVDATGTSDSEVRTSLIQGKHGMVPPKGTLINCDDEDLGGQAKKSSFSPSEPVKVIVKEASFTCPICWNELVDACSTICGHIFCETCIKQSIKKCKNCPTCRKKLNMNNFHRIYLPNSAA